jgi:hypothetical protein
MKGPPTSYGFVSAALCYAKNSLLGAALALQGSLCCSAVFGYQSVQEFGALDADGELDPCADVDDLARLPWRGFLLWCRKLSRLMRPGEYSWTMPPSRSRRRTRPPTVPASGSSAGPASAASLANTSESPKSPVQGRGRVLEPHRCGSAVLCPAAAGLRTLAAAGGMWAAPSTDLPGRTGDSDRGVLQAFGHQLKHALAGLCLPEICATRRYSWMTPPARSCRRTLK